MKLRKHILSVLLLGFGLVSYADTTLPSKVEAFMPNVLMQRLVYEKDADAMVKRGDWGQSNAPTNKKHWVVYSDRDENTTYSSPSKGAAYDKLDFAERVIIAKIQNGFALVYSDPKYPTWPAYSEKAKSRGWIPMDKLLLWQSCPTDNKGIYQKALLAANLEAKSTNNLGSSYSNPETRSNPQPIKTTMNFYYVMKKDPATGLKLISRQLVLDENAQLQLYGWVADNSFVPWNQRSCLEPNWRPSDVSYFNSPDGKAYPVYQDVEMKKDPVTSYRYGVPNPEDKMNSTKFRMRPTRVRFPILDLTDTEKNYKNVYKCTTFGGSGLSVLNDADTKDDEAKKKLQQSLEKIRNINIIFVIDGTRSMERYFPSVKEAIKSGIQYFDPNTYNMRVGVVIYRDYADGEFLTESVPLTNAKSPQLQSFLDTAGKYGAKSSTNDHTAEEALYKGLEVATDAAKMGYNKDQSNVIVVVGDCGNADNDTKCISKEDIVKRLADNNVSVLSFQVRSQASPAWELFNDQMCDIIRDNLTEQYRRLYADINPKFKPLGNGYDFTSNTKLEFLVGSIRFPENLGSEMSASLLATLIEEKIGKFSEAVLTQIATLIESDPNVRMSGDGSQQDIQIRKAFIISRIGKEAADALENSGVTLAFTGYAPKTDSQKRNYWQAVAYMSREELEELMDRLKIVYDNANPEGDRKPYVDAIKALIRVMVPDVTNKDMDEMGISEVMRLAAGLNEASSSVTSYTLTEIQDAHAVPDDEYSMILSKFIERYQNLDHNVLKNKRYPYTYKDYSGHTFYWIPVEDLP